MCAAPEIEERVSQIVKDVLKTDDLNPSTDLIEAGVLDSLGFVELIARLELEFGIRITLESAGIEQFRSIQAIAQFAAGAPETVAACSR